jgi:hypothetical protein
MANWLDKALGRKDGMTSVEVVPFEIRCECGARVTGMRADRAKRAICAQCGEAHFILPINQYPESERSYFGQQETKDDSSDGGQATRNRRAEQSSSSADAYVLEAEDLSAAVTDDDYEYLDDGPVEVEPPESSANDAPDDLLDFLNEPPEPQTRSRKRRNSLYEAPVSDQQNPAGDDEPPKSAARPEKSRRTGGKSRSGKVPTGMIEVRRSNSDGGETRKRVIFVVAGIFVLVAGMAIWAIRSQSVDHAEARLTAAQDAGLDAFEVGDFPEAHRQLQIALEALDIVGADEEQIAPIRRRWLEAEFATRLLDGTLIDIAEATRDAESLDREEWEKQFDVRFAGRWLLLDLSPVERKQCSVKDADGEVQSTETRLVYPWTVDDKAVQIAGVESLVTGDRQRIVLAGRLAGSEFDSDAKAWVVRLDPDDSFLWTDFSVLVQLGFVVGEDDGLRDVLRAQQSGGGSQPDTELAENTPGDEAE